MVEKSTGVILELDQNPWLAFGSIDQAASVQAMISISVALMLLLMTLDFASGRRGRYVLALAMTGAGTVASVIGLCWQKTAELRVLWQVPNVPDSVFGLFWYHGNAAAFLNLTWPAGLWLCVMLLRNRPFRVLQQVVLALLVAALLVQIIAVFVNVSKMGHLMFFMEVGLMLLAALIIWRPRRVDLLLNARRLSVFVIIGVALLLLGAWLGGAGDGIKRWNVFAGRRFDDPARRHAATMALQIGVDQGWAGSGPGTFEWVAAHYTTLDPVLNGGRWRHAHNDYAQFFAEWGWLGAGLCALTLWLAGRRILGALRAAFSKDSGHLMSFHRRTGLICFFITLLAVLTHALVDFPLQIEATRHLAALVTGLVLAMTVTSAQGFSRSKKKVNMRAGRELPLV